MDSSAIRTAFEDVCDQAIVFHGYAKHMRVYDVFISAVIRPLMP